MAVVGLDLAVSDVDVVRSQRLDDLSGLVGRIKPVRADGEDQELGLHRPEGLGQR